MWSEIAALVVVETGYNYLVDKHHGVAFANRDVLAYCHKGPQRGEKTKMPTQRLPPWDSGNCLVFLLPCPGPAQEFVLYYIIDSEVVIKVCKMRKVCNDVLLFSPFFDKFKNIYKFSCFMPPSSYPFPRCFKKDHLLIHACDLDTNVHFFNTSGWVLLISSGILMYHDVA